MSENLFHWSVLVILSLIFIQLVAISSSFDKSRDVMEQVIDNLSLKLSSLISLVEVESINLENISEKFQGVHDRFPSEKELKKYYDNQP